MKKLLFKILKGLRNIYDELDHFTDEDIHFIRNEIENLDINNKEEIKRVLLEEKQKLVNCMEYNNLDSYSREIVFENILLIEEYFEGLNISGETE